MGENLNIGQGNLSILEICSAVEMNTFVRSHHFTNFSEVKKAKNLEPGKSSCVTAERKLSSQRLQGEVNLSFRGINKYLNKF